MKKNLVYYFSFLSLLILIGLSSCAVNPRCPTQLMPVVEVQVNNTSSNHDDYISTGGFTSCRARITNVRQFSTSPSPGPLNFPGGVEIEVRNRRLASELIISPTNSGTTTSFFATLPDDGSWLNFFIRGNSLSTTDKSTILELATASVSCNEVVVTRKGLMVTNTPPLPTGAPQVEIQVGSISHLDDYITWAPTGCTIKWLNPPNSAATLNVTLRNISGSNKLRFSSTAPATGSTATNTTVNLTLLGDNTTASFYMAGNFGNASVSDKDAIFEVVDAGSSQILSREGVMVRIRKNGNTLSVGERDRYLEALREVHQTYAFYTIMNSAHSQPPGVTMHRQAHSGSAFLPWHRAFILNYERLIQSSDPSIALPYWRFDNPAPNIFTADFMGSNSTNPANPNFATLATGNPIVAWNIPADPGGLRRRTPYGDAGAPTLRSELGTLALGSNYDNFIDMEPNPHNLAHARSGFTAADGSPLAGASWVGGSPTIAPRDPLFYFLHCNIDRLWAKWQDANDRYDATQVASYNLQGSHASPPAGLPPQFTQNPMTGVITVNRTLGQYVDDTLWPWDDVKGGVGAAARPTTAPLTPFPIVLGGFMPGSRPTVKLMIDLRAINFAYDDFFPY
jgi:tyrosinase